MLRQVSENIWCAEDELFMPGKIHFTCRMTLVRLADKRLLLISPIRMSDDLAREIDALGQVTWLVAPNAFHHLFLRDSLKRWPEAEMWAAPALPKKRKNLSFTGTLDGELPQAWQAEIDTQLIAGAPKMTEVVFFHKPSKTLIVTDLIFNIQKYKNRRTGLVLRLVGAHKKVAQSRAWRLIVKDRRSAGKSAAAVFRWDFERVIMAHGNMIEDNAKANLKQGLTWMLKDSAV